MPIQLLLLVIGAAILVKGADLLVDGGVGIALKNGISPLVVGLTVVAFGTSAPELTVSLIAAFQGSGAISYTNVVGSNIANIALILGVTAVIAPIAVNRSLLRWELPFLLAITAFVAVLGYLDGASRLSGIVLLVLFGYYLHHCFKSPGETPEVHESYANKTTMLLTGMVIAGAVGLALGGKLFVDAAIDIALRLGISEAVVGLTVVALGTSLPELVTSVVASLKQQEDISLGNIVGSNIFNILLVIGATATINPFPLPSDPYMQQVGIPSMIIAAVVLVPFSVSGKRINRLEGAFLCLLYAVTIALAFVIR